MQDHIAERDAVIEGGADKMQRPAGGGLGPGFGDGRELAGGDHLREHHRRRLQRLLLLLGVSAPSPVLHHEHAECVSGAQDGHAEERVVDLLARFRAI